jgi:hypothetical protein
MVEPDSASFGYKLMFGAPEPQRSETQLVRQVLIGILSLLCTKVVGFEYYAHLIDLICIALGPSYIVLPWNLYLFKYELRICYANEARGHLRHVNLGNG